MSSIRNKTPTPALYALAVERIQRCRNVNLCEVPIAVQWSVSRRITVGYLVANDGRKPSEKLVLFLHKNRFFLRASLHYNVFRRDSVPLST